VFVIECLHGFVSTDKHSIRRRDCCSNAESYASVDTI